MVIYAGCIKQTKYAIGDKILGLRIKFISK